MTRKALITIAATALVASGAAVGGEIYKWTDEDGNIHYEDRPTGSAPVQRVAIVSRNTDNEAVQARVQAKREARATAEQVASEAPPEMSREEIRAEGWKSVKNSAPFAPSRVVFVHNTPS